VRGLKGTKEQGTGVQGTGGGRKCRGRKGPTKEGEEDEEARSDHDSSAATHARHSDEVHVVRDGGGPRARPDIPAIRTSPLHADPAAHHPVGGLTPPAATKRGQSSTCRQGKRFTRSPTASTTNEGNATAQQQQQQ